MPLFLLKPSLFLLFFPTLLRFASASPKPISGLLPSPLLDASSSLSVVAYARSGAVIDVAPVLSNASFTLYDLAHHRGLHIISVLGGLLQDFEPVFVQINDDGEAAFETRNYDLAMPPKDISRPSANSSSEFVFVVRETTNYTRRKQPWRLTDLWKYKFRVLQGAALLFVLWFPQFIRSLPDDIRAELMGEKVDNTDPTVLVKALAGFVDEKKKNGRAAASSSSSK